MPNSEHSVVGAWQGKVHFAECGIFRRCILWNFRCGNNLRNKVYFAE